MKKPVIALTSGFIADDDIRFGGSFRNFVNDDYIQSVEKCGGIPVILPVQSSKENILPLLEMCDGVILTGGNDIDPLLYNEAPIREIGLVISEVDEFYMKVIECAESLNKPVLGICKGHQALNVAYGGTLYQDLKVQKSETINHFQNALRYQPTHHVFIEEENILYDLFQESLLVNSYHHQAIKDLAHDFKVIATSEDGVIEAIEKTEGTYMLGIQWHPEMMIARDHLQMLTLVKAFIDKCKKV